MRKLALALTSLAALLLTSAAAAQTPERVRLSAPDLQKFPTVSVTLDVRDTAGHFLSGLKKDQVTLLENGSPVPMDTLKESQTPLEVSVALDPGASMAVYTPSGSTRYEVVSSALAEWASQPSSGQADQFNLFASPNDPKTGLSFRSDWLTAFANLPAPAPDVRPSLASLTQAIQQAEANPAPAGVARVILWVTSTPEGTMVAGLPDLVARAQKADVRLFVWLVSPEVVFQSESGRALQNAAAQTGGEFFGFSGAQLLPKLDDWFNPLRGKYTLTYTSHAHQGGDQSLSVHIDQPDGALESAPLAFQLDLQPPNPILLSPPAQIRRTCPAGCTDPAAQMTPATTTLRILVEFPDGHTRPLSATRLYVDGKLAAERTAEPFTAFAWNLSALTQSGQHHLSVEAVDSLGMSKRSLELPVQVEVTIIRQTWWQKLLSRPGVVPGASVAVALLGLAGSGFAFRRRLPGWLEHLRSLPRLHGRSRAIGLAKPAADRAPGRSPSARRFGGHPEEAFSPAQTVRLVRLGEDERPTADPPISFSGRELTLGSDAARAEIVIQDSSLDGLHARLVWGADGCVWIKDAGSTAGAWVNCELVPPAGRILAHGDLIHLGRAAFRFELTRAPVPRQVLIEKESELS